MGEMREFWVNCYRFASGPPLPSVLYPTRTMALMAWATSARPGSFRIHVRLKPEGAPKRYASEGNRRAWEEAPGWCIDAMQRFGVGPESVSK